MSTMLHNENLYISGDNTRLFLNLELGCGSSCSYCYLPAEGMRQGERLPLQLFCTPELLLEQLSRDARFVRGRHGTILSIGCFSECWNLAIKPQTIRLIENLLVFDNWIQFVTKCQIMEADLQAITSNSHWRDQVLAYISSATISQWQHYERDTTPPDQRFQSFAACAASGLRACLYIKPVLPGVTLQDADLYGSIMQTHGINAVVGDLFIANSDCRDTISVISRHLHVVEHPEVASLRSELERFGLVFENSTQNL